MQVIAFTRLKWQHAFIYKGDHWSMLKQHILQSSHILNSSIQQNSFHWIHDKQENQQVQVSKFHSKLQSLSMMVDVVINEAGNEKERVIVASMHP